MDFTTLIQFVKKIGAVAAAARIALFEDGTLWAFVIVSMFALYLLYKLLAPRFYVDAMNRAHGKGQREDAVKLFCAANPPPKTKDQLAENARSGQNQP